MVSSQLLITKRLRLSCVAKSRREPGSLAIPSAQLRLGRRLRDALLAPLPATLGAPSWTHRAAGGETPEPIGLYTFQSWDSGHGTFPQVVSKLG